MPLETKRSLRWRSIVYSAGSGSEAITESFHEDVRGVPLGEWSYVEHRHETGAPDGWSFAWEALRGPFQKLGITLFQRASCDYTLPELPEDSLGPVRGDITFPVTTPRIFPALDRKFVSRAIHCSYLYSLVRNARYLALKVLKADEYEFLKVLNTEPLVSDPQNSTVVVYEFVSLGTWTFAVMPFYEVCYETLPRNTYECLEFQGQVLQALDFLHNSCRIAHLDISHENIYRDIVSKDDVAAGAKYILADFDVSVRIPPGALQKCSTDRLLTRRSVAPEITRRAGPFDPFAADVYQTGVFFYDWFGIIVMGVPGLFELLQDMSSFDPCRRPPIEEALDRFRAIRDSLPSEAYKSSVPARVQPRGFTDFVPRSRLRVLSELYRGGGVGMVGWFLLRQLRERADVNYRMHLYGPIRRRYYYLRDQWHNWWPLKERR